MNDILLVLGSILVAALVIFITYKMAGRQQIALAAEGRAIPPKMIIFIAGLLTTLTYTIAIICAILIMLAPFINLSIAGSGENTTNVLFIIILAAVVIGSGAYWFFVRLGFFSWKIFSLD